MEKQTKALTIGDLAEACNCPIHRVEYLLRSRKIEPVMRAGNYRVYASEVVDTLKGELEKIEQRRAVR